MKPIRSLFLLAALLVSCGASAQLFVAEFDPADGILPNPINLLFTGSTDGTLNIPNPAGISTIDALNALDGFSTVAPLTATFSSAIDPATLLAGDSVRVYEVTIVNPFLDPGADAPFSVTGITAELSGGEDFSAGLLVEDPEQRTLLITPLKPLKPKTAYMVVLTDTIRAADGRFPFPDLPYIFARYRKGPLVDANGNSLFPQLSDEQAQALEPIRRITVSQEDAYAATGMRRGHIVLSWSFMTQSVGDVLQLVRAGAIPRSISVAPTGLSTAALGLGLPGLADIYAGSLQIPYYLQAPDANPALILSTFWQGVNNSLLTRYNPQPVTTRMLTIPLLATFPNTTPAPAAGWPVVIFQHGVGRSRSDVVLLADALAGAGFAAIAIDLPLHGVTDTTSPFYTGGLERTFNVDLINNETSAPGPDGRIDESGVHFINPASLLSSRDNLRQAVADLLQLSNSLPALDIHGDGLADIDSGQMHFWGYSLGGIAGATFVGVDDARIAAASLTAVGGGLAQLLQGSQVFGPVIAAGLAGQGLTPGTPAYEAFFRAAQQVLDSADPINYAVAAADLHPIHMIEMVGPPPDQFIPNSVPGAPLAGTEALARIMDLQTITATTADANGIRGIVRLTEGEHRSLLSPAASLAATLEMQSESVAFLAAGGTFLPIANPAIVRQTEFRLTGPAAGRKGGW